MNLNLSDVLFVGLIIMIVAGLLAGLGELRDWLSEGRELDRVRRLAALDSAARTPVARTGQLPIGDLVVNPVMERYAEVRARAAGNPGRPPDCLFCAPFWDASQPCRCGAIPCDDPGCGALAWQAVANTEEWER